MYTRSRPKSIFILVVNENADENEIPFTAENDMKTEIHFRPKNDNESHLIILVFFSFQYIQSPSQPTMRRQYLVQFRLFAGDP